MKEQTISIIGGGASAVAFIHNILTEIANRKDHAGLTIYMIERARHFGRGLAYDLDQHSNLLNTKAGFITPFSDKPGHFYEWLCANRNIWEDDYPNAHLYNENSFVPRSLFGLYLEHMVSDLVRRALAIGCHVIPVQAEATSITSSHDGGVIIKTKDNLTFLSDYAVLSLGNLPSREYQELGSHPGFFSSPYPLYKLVRKIPTDASVGVIGARLSAIDTVLGLISSGHRGPIALHSRSGFLPCVRGAQGRYQPKVITLDRMKSHVARFGTLSLQVFVNWIIDEMVHAGVDVTKFDWINPLPPKDILGFLKGEIAASDHPRAWQAVLYATNSVIDYVWDHTSEADRKFFWRYLSAWMAYRVSIPPENAKRMLSAMQSGQLTFVPGGMNITKTDSGFAVAVDHDGTTKTHNYKAIISAIGTPRDATQFDSLLIDDLLARGMARPHPYGGLEIEATTGRLRDQNGQPHNRIFALGELTSGTFFFTSVLEINARHARERAKLLADMTSQRFASEQQSEPMRVQQSVAN